MIRDSGNPDSLSVALCTFNGEKFLRAQLDSIASQSRAVQEIVITDDQSTDATPEIVRQFAAESAIPVHFHVNPSRLGVTKNFEKAVSLCQGQIIFLCDQDDLWRNDKVARLADCFADPAVGLALSNAQVVNEDLSLAGYNLWQSVWFDAAEQQSVQCGDALPVLLRHAVAAGSTLAFRAVHRSLVLPIPDFPHSHDIWITLLIAAVARICPLDENLIRYRLHASNTVGLKNHNLISQISMARKQISIGAFQYAADLHQAALDRLCQSNLQNPQLDRTKSLIAEKISHSRRRHDMPKHRFHRLPVIAQELRAGNYHKYSYGYKSVLQDLFLR